MSYTILTGAKVLISTDGSKSLAIDTGNEIVPITSNIVDFDALGITGPILLLFNAGGGDLNLYPDDGINFASVEQAFLQDVNFIAKLTIPDVGTMYVKPVYVTYDQDRFISAHFDSYFRNNNGLLKFYVRIEMIRMFFEGQGIKRGISVMVGFYA